MDTTYTIILGILFLLAIFDLVVGVSNDAANFLNSAVGCKAAKRSAILAVAAVGVVIGASFSSGMMEVARSGVFMPGMFTFHEVMILFLAVMLTDVILLDLFNTFGLPTSTTVSLVFELLGAAVAVAAVSIMMGGGDLTAELGAHINSANALTILTGIFASVAIAFTCGVVVMWFSRLLFSFRYQRTYKYVGALWVALALTSITYFAIFKGLKGSSILDTGLMQALDANMGAALGITFATWLVAAFVLQQFCKVNTLRLTVLAGTGALALAFAGNDLVNFIGVFMAAESAYATAAGYSGDVGSMTMESLMEPAKADLAYLIGAGLVMVAALYFSKKARTVTDTEVKLARGGSGGRERFGSCLPARVAVRYTLNAAKFLQRVTPAPIARFVGSRFKPLDVSEDDGAAFDLIRGTVNLTISALLISLATSLKLPLSTTYVTFMVAMGSSLADRAWGRDSAVYRITGVFTVIGGWFLTGVGAFTAACFTAAVMMYGGMAGIVLMILLAGAVLVKSAIIHSRKGQREQRPLDLSRRETMQDIGTRSAARLELVLGIYRATVNALLAEDRDALKRLRRRARDNSRSLKALKEDEILPSLVNLSPELATQGQILFRIHESSRSIAESLLVIVKTSYSHIDNNHTGLNSEQAEGLMGMCNKVADFVPGLCTILTTGDYSAMDAIMRQASDLSLEFADSITQHLVQGSDDENGVRTGILYLNLLNETRAMVRKSFSLIKEQRELLRA